MISATEFCTGHSSSWRLLTPFMDMFVRQINRGMYERWYAPVRNRCEPQFRGFQSELAFVLVESVWKSEGNLQRPVREITEEAIERARARLHRYRSRIPSEGYDLQKIDPLATLEIANRFRRKLMFFGDLEFQPTFQGCGIIAAAVGDVRAGDRLVEVKNVERGFRSTDLRQVLLYSSLNFGSSGQIFSAVEIANLSQGQVFSMDLEELASSVSGTNALGLFQSILDAISVTSVSA